MSDRPKLKIQIWDDNKTTSEVAKRYRNAAQSRIYQESSWRYNERLAFTSGNYHSPTGVTPQIDSLYMLPEVDASTANINVSYLMRNLRFLHAQMSANPPSVVMKPVTTDQDNVRRADAADKVVRFAMKKYLIQEKVDQTSLPCLLYGSGFLKTIWDGTEGEIVRHDPETGEVELEGDIKLTTPFIWNLYVDPDARCAEEIKWIIEEIYIDADEASIRWPGMDKVLETARIGSGGADGQGARSTTTTGLLGTGSANPDSNRRYNTVKLLEYWETGLPSNGYMGRYAVTTAEGLVVEHCRPNPFRFRSAGAIRDIEMNVDLSEEEKSSQIARVPERARLPYLMLTDIDVPNAVYGKSALDYAANLQDTLGKIDSATLDAIEAHSVARMVVSKDTEIVQIGNSNWDVTQVEGGPATGPYFMHPPQLMPEMDKTRNYLVQGINDVMGLNESQFGQQSREQAQATMQYAVNQGNMIRRRLFNKYVLFTEALYRNILDLVRKHWDTKKTIHVIGREHALEAVDLQGMDVDGGYDVVGDYGVSLSLDPVARKQELLMLQPLLKEAGIPARRTLQLMKLSELEGAYDEIELADNRQREIFEKICASVEVGVPPEEAYIPPKKYMDHANMIAYALRYFMTEEFQNLPDMSQQLLEQHVDARAQLAAQEKLGSGAATPTAQIPGTPPGPVPQQPNPAGAQVMSPGPQPQIG